MNSENIFLSKQIEQVDITDPSIDQRGKTNKPSVKKPEGFLCSEFKDVSPAVQWQRGAGCRWQKGYTHCKKSRSWGKQLPQHQGQEYLGSPCSSCGHTRSLVCELCWVITCYMCHRLGPDGDWNLELSPVRNCTMITLKSKPAALSLPTKKLFLSYLSCLNLQPSLPPFPRGSPKPSIRV